MRMRLINILLALPRLLVGVDAKPNGPSELPLYGLSPPFYPSPVANGSSSPRWAAAYRHARAVVGQLTIEEKVNLTNGRLEGPCVGNLGSISRLGVAALCFADGPDGVRGEEFVSAFPAGIHVAATFDQSLMYEYGRAYGEENRAKGINVAMGPVAGPLGRVVLGGRNWEGLSNDPYLAGTGMGAITRGIQDAGVIATPKHWLLNEQEHRRLPGEQGEAISANVDDRTLHELYVFPFMDALREGAASIMCSYQRVNHSYACQNSALLNGVLKTELGFEGFVVSDWGAQRSGVASANAGLDVVMPNAAFWGDSLKEAVANGSVSESRLSDMARRVLASIHYLGQADAYPSLAVHSHFEKAFPFDAQGDHASLIRKIGAAGTVLVKNVNGTLPLGKPRFLAVYGKDATHVAAPWTNPARFGGGYERSISWETLDGTLITGGGSGSNTPPYVVTPFEAIQDRLRRHGGIVRWDFASEDPEPAFVNAEAALVFINAYASERYDRTSLTDSASDRLVQNVASKYSNTIVVVHSAGIRIVDAWIDHPNVTAVIFGGLPGQETGNSLADVLFGDVNPSGKLPYTVARRESDYGHLLNATVTPDYFPETNFNEGLHIDYRYFDAHDIEPRFEFGFGLSYTTFSFADLRLAHLPTAELGEYLDSAVAVVQGGHPALWEVVALASVSVTNAGHVDGREVAQLYVKVPGGDSPVRQLRGFIRTGVLVPGQTEEIVFELTRRDLSVWDTSARQWRLLRGTYRVWAGASSRDLKLQASFHVNSDQALIKQVYQ